jgi:hypothetical protein
MRTFHAMRVAAVGAALLLLGTVTAQPPGGKGAARKDKATQSTATAKADSGLDAWIKILGEKMTDRHDAIRDSARAALVAIGEPALPALKQLAESDDSATVTAAKKVIAQIDGPRRGGPPAMGRGGFGGFGGGGPADGGGFGRGFGGGFGRPGTPAPAGGPTEPPKPDDKKEKPKEGTPVPGGTFGGGPAGSGGGFGFTMGRSGRMLDMILKEIELTDKQKDKVKEIVAAQEKKVRDVVEKLRTTGQPDFQSARDAMVKMEEGLLKELKAALTEEQGKKLEKLFERGPAGPGGFSRPNDREKKPDQK